MFRRGGRTGRVLGRFSDFGFECMALVVEKFDYRRKSFGEEGMILRILVQRREFFDRSESRKKMKQTHERDRTKGKRTLMTELAQKKMAQR